MSASDLARNERRDLADLLLGKGPDAPTLCAGWTTRDLAAHLVVRESRPDAAAGILIRPLEGWTQRVQDSVAAQPYPELVRKVRTGPPTLSMFAIPGVDGAANLVEFFVHHEDVRRGGDAWAPRELDPALADALWGRLNAMARLLFRRVPSGVRLERTDGSGGSIVARKGTGVVLRGPAAELLLRAYGRHAVQVETLGSPTDVAAFEAAPLGV